MVVIIFFIALILTTLIRHEIPHYTSQDFQILLILACFMFITKGLEKSGILEWIAINVEKGRLVELKIILFTFFSATLITNDIALLVVLPLIFNLRKADKLLLTVLTAIAANAGSMLSPLGNPQNLYIYHYYDLHPLSFLKTMLPFGIFYLILLLIFCLFCFKSSGGAYEEKNIEKIKIDKLETVVFTLAFFFFIGAILKVIPLIPSFIAVVLISLFSRNKKEILYQLDYNLLLIFFFFFGFTDNLNHLLNLPYMEGPKLFYSSLLISQIISNVPSALIFSEITKDWKNLLYGVNIGGFGFIMGSLANLIAYKLYISKYKDSKKFLIVFHIFNFIFLFLGILFYEFSLLL